jgi:hypothetical protein
MRPLIRTFLVRSLFVWGAISLIGVLALAGLIGFNVWSSSGQANDRATFKDVRFVLNWCELGDKRFVRLVHSHVSARSMGGDHLDAYAINISQVSPSELLPTDYGGWHRGDQLPKVMEDAVAFAGGFGTSGEIPWFPTETDIRGETYYVYLERSEYHGTQVSAIDLIFIRPSDNMVFYIGLKT